MYVYLLWDHGHEGNYAWNSILLPATCQMDFGVEEETQEHLPPPPPILAPPSTGRKKRRSPSQDDDSLIDASNELLAQLRSASSTTVTSVQVQVSQEITNADNAKALAVHADVLKTQWTAIPADQDFVKGLLMASWVSVLTQLAAIGRQ
jgi:hypothetical protein